MSDMQEIMDAIVKAFEELAMKVKEIVDALAEGFDFLVMNTDKKKSLCSPAKYGMFLRKLGRKSFVKQYSYLPVGLKNLPYHRRNY